MKSKKTITVLYLSLGSNVTPRLKYLQQSLLLISEKIGIVTLTSKIYETPSWGFTSSPFLNNCICISTYLNTKTVLIELQKIEKELGRNPKTGINYEDRPIDLDIIYSSEGVFNYPYLTVPHPLLQHRKFVLKPLSDIAPKYIHPLLHKTTCELLEHCSDNATITETTLQLS